VRLPPGPPLVWRRPDLLGDGQTAFWDGRFALARDYWEAEALITRGAERRCIQGLAKVAAGFLASDEGKSRIAERLLSKGLRRLEGAPRDMGGVRLNLIRAAADLLDSALRRGQPASARGLVFHQWSV
jgi:predicted metal-dependent hydrolase